MNETYDVSSQKFQETDSVKEVGNRLQKQGGTTIDRLKEEANSPFVILGAIVLSLAIGYVISQRREARKREQWAEILFQQLKEWLLESGKKAAGPLKEKLEYARSAAEDLSRKAMHHGGSLNPFDREPGRRFFGLF